MKLRGSLFAFVSLPLLLVACSDGGPTTGTDGGPTTGTDGGPTTGTDGGPTTGTDGGPTETFDTRSVTAGPIRVAAGVERTQCASFDLGNDAPAMIRRIRTHLSEGSHHMIVYHLDEAPDPTFRDCGAFMHGVGASLFIAQQREASIAYPDGTAFPIAAHQTIGVEIHYINYVSTSPIDVSGVVDFDLVELDPSYREVELLFTGDLALSLPPRATTTERSFQPVPDGAEIFALTSHTHQYGILSTIHRGTSTSALGEELHRSTNWAEPPLDIFDPPLALSSGEGLVITCMYDNTSDRTVTFGTGFDDEMCFLWAYFIR
jgi:hypothetical protein